MTITIETSNIQEVEQVLNLLKAIGIKSVKVHDSFEKPVPAITEGDKNIDPEDLFGIWATNPRNIEEIRSTAWARNWNG